ncbi:MAG TPA: protein kinase [Kofleriaceae bacterium]|nr:protein kinase [Kofleriaceae bacterium]
MSATGEAGRPSRLGRYELITRIGQGGMAEVQLALQRGPAGFEKLVVVKLVHENLASQRAFVDMLLDEARVAALVKHPNVVDIYDLGEVEGRYFIAMEYLEGEPLLAVLRAGRDGKRLDPLSTARLIADTAEGLDAAHELRSMAGQPLELVHHDISLGNIVVLYNGQVKLVDFGVAKATQSASTRTKVQGKFSYMAPEKLQGASGDRRSDIFSLGCVLWEALTLKRLYKGANDADTMKQVLEQVVLPPSQVNGDVIADFDPICARALSRDPAGRYSTAKELAADLEEVLRKQGYAAKNDLIARYMQDTFKSHIEARKKLLQEVSSKGSTTAEVIEAAFADAGPQAITGPNEFSVKFRRETSSLPPPVRRKSDPTLPPSELASSSAVLAVGTDSITDMPRSPEPRAVGTSSEPPEPAEPEPVIEVMRPRANRQPMYYVIGGAVTVALIVVVIAMAGGGSKHDATSKRAEIGLAPPSQPDQIPAPSPSVVDTRSDAPPPVAPVPAPVEVTADPDPTVTSSKPHTPKVAKKPVSAREPKDTHTHDKPDVDALFKAGFQAYVRGDTKTALDSFQHAKAASPGFAPAWRGLGMVYEKIGDSKAAKSAFQRYLALAPTASDASTIRQRMEGLP